MRPKGLSFLTGEEDRGEAGAMGSGSHSNGGRDVPTNTQKDPASLASQGTRW
jgi:hypothetical protein